MGFSHCKQQAQRTDLLQAPWLHNVEFFHEPQDGEETRDTGQWQKLDLTLTQLKASTAHNLHGAPEGAGVLAGSDRQGPRLSVVDLSSLCTAVINTLTKCNTGGKGRIWLTHPNHSPP